jgi:hypothetical protein
MAQDSKMNRKADITLPQPSSKDLMGRQSVRATFKLTSKAIEALSTVSFHLGIKQKSLFDHLIDDLAALEIIAREVESRSHHEARRIQKTYVLSRKTLSCLEQAAKEFEASRDALVEFSIQRLMPVIEKEKRKHQRRKQLLSQVDRFLAEGKRLLADAREALGEDDPLYSELKRAIIVLQNAGADMADFIEKGKMIENF